MCVCVSCSPKRCPTIIHCKKYASTMESAWYQCSWMIPEFTQPR